MARKGERYRVALHYSDGSTRVFRGLSFGNALVIVKAAYSGLNEAAASSATLARESENDQG